MLTVTKANPDVSGRRREVDLVVSLDASYPSGGYSLPLQRYGILIPDLVLASPKSGILFEYDYTNKKLKAIYPKAGGVYSTMVGSDIKGSANTDSENADAASEPTNGHAVAAAAAVSGGAWTHGAITNPDMGRNVGVVINNPTGGALNLYVGVMTFTITGTWRGAAQTETITFTSTNGNKAVANAKWRYKYGVKPFDTVTNFTLDNVPDNALTIALGLGSKIGLYNDLYTPTEADVVKITKNAANLSPSGIVGTTYMTVNLGTLADGDDFTIAYKTAGTASEVAAGTDLSAMTGIRIYARGRQ